MVARSRLRPAQRATPSVAIGFKMLRDDAGIGANWTPRELRHTFVSIMSEQGVPVEELAHLVGHSTTSTTETVYRMKLRPVIATGAEVMDNIFKIG